jgi:hypothetical protein
MEAAMTRPFWRLGLALALALALVLGTACAGKDSKPTVADQQVAAVEHVLADLAHAINAKDAGAVAALWSEAGRSAARERVRAAFAGDGASDVSLTLVGLRLEPDRRLARVAWKGRWGGKAVSGGFEMELNGADPPRILEIRGEDPTGTVPPGAPPETAPGLGELP